MRQDIFDLLPTELESDLKLAGYKPYRVRQVLDWLYRNGAESFAAMANVPADVRSFLAENYTFYNYKTVQMIDDGCGTRKFLLELVDGFRVEAVIIETEGRVAFCVSSQLGCSFDCAFCRTGKLGFRRNLSTAEIIGQYRVMAAHAKMDNLVFMGMGEPLANYKHVVKAVRLLSGQRLYAISPRRITISTCGLVPAINRLAATGLNVNLTISLNAVDDKTRCRLMTVAQRYGLSSLLQSLRNYPVSNRQRVIFSYVLLDGINDSSECAHKLVAIIKQFHCKANLIVYNENELEGLRSPPQDRVDIFQRIVIDAGISTFVRKSKGTPINAACGQLAAGYNPQDFK